jgi:hypothetical protein
MTSEVHHRPFAAFLSHAHADQERTDALYRWLTDCAGLEIWYDKNEFSPSHTIPGALSSAVEQCRSMIIALSKTSVASGWVREEIATAITQRATDSDFRVIPVLLEDCDIPRELRTTRWIDLRPSALPSPTAADLLKAFYGQSFGSVASCDRDVYMSTGWRNGEEELTYKVVSRLSARGFRAIGDSKDQLGFAEGGRASSLIRSCGALLAVLPHRGNGNTSRFIFEEIALAQKHDVPVFMCAATGVDLHKAVDHAVESLKLHARLSPQDAEAIKQLPLTVLSPSAAEAEDLLDNLVEDFTPPKKPHYVFLSHKFKEVDPELYRIAKQMISGITCMPCEDGDDIKSGNISQAIIRRIRDAFLLVADVSQDNINSCIEAGIGYGANITVKLIARGDRHRPAPFMFRNEQVFYFDSDADLIGVLHRVLRPYRRRDIAGEVLAQI